MSDKPEIDDLSGTDTTGHEWDGIKELNTPMPRWWLYIFYGTIVWAVIYMILMPAIPVPFGQGYTPGIRGQSDRAKVAVAMEELDQQRVEFASKLRGATLETIQADEELFSFAMAAGRSAFGDNCATCHGSGAQGFKGYPNLNDDVWLWGGTFEDIKYTLNHGIRSTDDDTRFSLMQAYGRDGILDRTQIRNLTHYVRGLGGLEHDPEKAAAAAADYARICTSCHMADGTGDRRQGAPNLTDAEWLYGSDFETIEETLYYGRQGVMPYWSDRLSPETITALAVYVHSLGGGEEGPAVEITP